MKKTLFAIKLLFLANNLIELVLCCYSKPTLANESPPDGMNSKEAFEAALTSMGVDPSEMEGIYRDPVNGKLPTSLLDIICNDFKQFFAVNNDQQSVHKIQQALLRMSYYCDLPRNGQVSNATSNQAVNQANNQGQVVSNQVVNSGSNPVSNSGPNPALNSGSNQVLNSGSKQASNQGMVDVGQLLGMHQTGPPTIMR